MSTHSTNPHTTLAERTLAAAFAAPKLSPLRMIVRAVRGIVRAIANRRAVMQLSGLDERMLKDIGLNRSDVSSALDGGWHRDPSSVLVTRSVERRAAFWRNARSKAKDAVRTSEPSPCGDGPMRHAA